MQHSKFDIAGPVQIQPRRLGDARGYFAETFRSDLMAEVLGTGAQTIEFVQENESLSARVGTVRGLHFQSPPFAQAKLVRCLAGALLDVVVDIRRGSPNYGRWLGVELSAQQGNQIWVPEGFAHGFCTLKPNTVISYKVTAYYSAKHDKGLYWIDPTIGVVWPECADPETLSAKDRIQPRLADLPDYFTYEA